MTWRRPLGPTFFADSAGRAAFELVRRQRAHGFSQPRGFNIGAGDFADCRVVLLRHGGQGKDQGGACGKAAKDHR